MNHLNFAELLQEVNLADHLKNIPMAVIGFNSSREITYWSQAAAEVFGWEQDEALYQPYTAFQLVHEEDGEKVAGMISELFEGRRLSNECSNRNYTKTGRVVHCDWHNSALKDADGNVVSVLCLVKDVTAYETALCSAEESNRQLSLIYNRAFDPMWLIQIEEEEKFRFTNINASFTKATGLEHSAVVGRLIEDVLPVSSHKHFREKCREVIQTQKVLNYIQSAVFPAGEKTGEIRLIPIKDQQGKVTQIVGMANDMTKTRAVQERLKQEQQSISRKVAAAVIESQEAERSFIGRELHDNVNQVLTTVKLYTELCSSGAVDAATILPKCTELLNGTINEIRRISKQLAVPEVKEVSLSESLLELVEMINDTNTIDLQLHIPSLPCSVIDEQLQIGTYRIAQEHLTNILKHAAATEVTVTLECTGDFLKLQMADNGIGFDTTKKSAGIGITNMKNRAAIHSGTLSIESAKGKGCTLSLAFPVNCCGGRCTPLYS